ncbi:TetR/AcrR family transcriptional regulator [Macrococcoides caseolyticum]|uniref:TetR/AcrR family transcriptional regulator n=1 Tax=Macrococcoides caseolyticum TaxID=69966 RepID=UPI001F2BDDB5|nr:TetR family transcriptional regulator C-terminal domain-containing protein [Macrococcus caseolyticus]MCE4958005.1 TetR family transcriptional regulator C-terminal domain-containing protein [Macrococcus caseolyticus]
MPKIVNHEEKKQHILEIAYQNIQEHGRIGTSVRSIANAANMTTGQVRYYYPNHSVLLEDILAQLTKEIEHQIIEIFTDQTEHVIQRMIQAILLTIPLDKKRRADMIVWLAVQNQNSASVDQSMSNEIYILSEKVYEILKSKQLLKSNINKEKAVHKLHALIDGLALHKLYQPDQLSNELIVEIISDEIHSWME